MARRPAPGARDCILDAAARLFHDHGARNVGLQQVIDEAGCGKNLLYREFASKDDLVVAYLERCIQEWTATLDQATQPHAGDPAAQLVAIVRAVAEQVAAPDHRGCPFHNTLAQFPDATHPAHQVSLAHKTALRAQLHGLAERAGAGDPANLADRVMLIVDGVWANGTTLGNRGAAAAAVAFADDVVRAATRPPVSASSTRI